VPDRMPLTACACEVNMKDDELTPEEALIIAGAKRDEAERWFRAYLHLDSETAENVQDYMMHRANN